MRRKVKAISNNQNSPKGISNGTEATTSTRGRRKNGISGQSKVNDFKRTSVSRQEKGPFGSEKTENEIFKEVQIKLSRCDEFDELDKMEPRFQTEQKRLKISARKNIKVKASCSATGSIKTDADFGMGTASDVVIDSNQVDEVAIKSKTKLKKLKESNEGNSSKATDVETDEDFIKPNSKTTRKKLKNVKPESSSKATEHVQENEDKKTKLQTRMKKLKKSEENIDKVSEGNAAEKDEDVPFCDESDVDSSSKQHDRIKPKSKTSAKALQNSKRSKKNTISEISGNLDNDDIEVQINMEIKEGSHESSETLKSNELELPVDVTEKVKTVSHKAEKDNKRKKGKQSEDVKDEYDVRPTKSAKEGKDSGKSKNSKEESPEAPDNLMSNNETLNNDATAVQINMEKSEDIEQNVETSELPVDVTEKVNDVPNKTDKGTKRKRGKPIEDDEEAKPTKSAKKEKEPAKSKSSKEKIPDVTDIDFSNDSKSPSGNKWNFKISSWNVNGIRAWLEKNGLSYVHHEMPDIICIQETKCSDDKLPEEVKKLKDYHTYWLSGDKDGYSGVGLLSKQEPIKVEYGIGISEHDVEGRVITAEYDKFYLVAAYVPNAGRKLVRLDYRKKWDVDFRAYIKKLDETKPVVLCGDLNVAHEEIDLANPKTNKKNAGFTIEEREGFSALLKEGFTDTFRQLYPSVMGAYTFWTYMMNARSKNVGWRLDYFVVSERFCENLCDSVIRKDVFGSDHCPISLFLSF